MKRLLPFAAAAVLSVSAACAESTRASNQTDSDPSESLNPTDTIAVADSTLSQEISEMVALVLTDMPSVDEKVKYETLTDEDFKIVANELGVEVAAIKAVVRIEAGPKLQGFWAPGVPVANYAQSLFNKYNKKGGRKIKDAKVPSGLSGYALKEWTSLTNARKTNADAADMGTYWGMFQIGGFNYKLCGCESVEEMVNKVCESEFSQLQMFAVFIRNSGMLDALRKKDWTTFARKYNGPSYAKRGYHSRMAKEYAKFKNDSSDSKQVADPDGNATGQIKSDIDRNTEEVSANKTATPQKKTPTRKKTRRKRTRK